ncbi:MAG: helix-turn-helix domain-containing protein, partial [Pseudomonadales bacterium]
LLDEAPQPGLLEANDFGRLFTALIKLAQHDIQQDASTADSVASLSTYRLMYVYMLQASDLQDAIERAAVYFSRFHDEQQSFSLRQENDHVIWQFHLDKSSESALDTAIGIEHFCMGKLNWLPGLPGRMVALYTWHRLCCWMIGNFIDLIAVNIDYPMSGSAEQYIEPFRAPLYFNQADCALVFHSRYLDFPIVQSEQQLNAMLEIFPAELMLADAMADSMAARVRGLLGQDFSRELPGLEEIAQRLYTTTPTLHRRLRDEGTSFQKLKDNCRRDASISLLRAGALSGAEIAEHLGFSDASTFYRAFKKWTGLTVREFKQQEA